ncbi:MAG: EAL domain-containing protein [Ornithinibacter sp.]
MKWEAGSESVPPSAREQDDRYRQLARGLLNASPGPVCAVDREGTIVAVNQAWIDVAGLNGGTAESCGVGANYLDTCERAARASGLDGVDAALVGQGIRQVLAGVSDDFSHDYACHSPGESRWFGVRVTPVSVDDGTGAVVTHVDITERYELQRSLARRSLHDPLTDLPDWALMLDRIDQAVRTSSRQGVAVGIVSLDLQAYRDVNERLGHHGWDAVLVQVAERLQAQLRPGDTLCRSAGEKFLVLWRDVDPHQPPDAVAMTERLLLALDGPFEVAGEGVRVSASAGAALHTPGQSVEDLLRAADGALQEARSRGPGHAVLCTENLRADATFLRSLEADLRRALTEDPSQFVLHYQPVVDLTTGRVLAVEALTRWQHPTWGLLGPERFIALAESAGLIHQLGSWVLHQAVHDATGFTHGGRDLNVAINVSVRQLDDRTVAHVQRALEGSRLSPRRLVLEVTESAFVEEQVTTGATLEALSRLGVQIAIDDFGTGYSSLLYVHRYPIGSLKIDREFIAGIGVSAEDEAICTSIVNLAAAVGASTVAEGVESMEQYAFLRSLGCRQGQGFLWSPAVPIDKLQRALAACDRVSATAPALPTALQRKRVDENLSALTSKRHGGRDPSQPHATAPEGTTGRSADGTREGTTWAAAVTGVPLPLGMLRPAPLVLVCEDIEATRRAVRHDLELGGFAVDEAADGHAAMALLIQPDTPHPDVIVVDCQQPPYDSWWAIAAIRAHHALDHVPALLVTDDAGDHHGVEAQGAGFDGIVAKPFAPDDLVRTVSLLAATGRQPQRRPRAVAAVRARDRLPGPQRRRRRQDASDPASTGPQPS